MSKICLVSIMLIGMLSSGFGWKKSLQQPNEAEYREEVDYRVRGELLLSKEEQRLKEPGLEHNVFNKGILSLKVRAYPGQAVTSLDGEQTIYVIVQDQRLLPVQGTQVSLVIHMPSGEEDRIIFPTLTNENGITQFVFSYTTKMIGIVEIKVTAVHEKLQATTSTCFWLWW